jgi:valyl-tRNA synthetase
MAKLLAQLEREVEELSAKLHNPAFLDRAPADVVEKTRRRLEEVEERRAALGGATRQ